MPLVHVNPQAWKLNPPQNFKTPKNYIKWNQLLKLSTFALETIRLHYQDPKSFIPEFNSEIGTSLLIVDCIGKSIPPICISEAFIEALLNTEIKPMEEPHCALENFIFLFPLKYSLFSPWKILEKHHEKVSSFDGNFVAAFVRITGNIIDCVFRSYNMCSSATYEWSDPFTNKDTSFDFSESTLEESILFERLIKNAILAYTYEPKYVSEETVSTSTRKGFGKNAEEKTFLPVRWLGKTFQKQQVKYVYTSTIDKTNRRTVKSHWRKGHWHTVCSGSKRKQRHLQWFKPVFVNAD